MRFLLPLFFASACTGPTAVVVDDSAYQTAPALRGSLIVLNKAEATASLVDLRTGKTVKTIKTGLGPNEVMVSPSGKVAVISNMGNQTPDKTLTVVSLPSGDVLKTIDLGSHGRPHGIAWLSEERILMTSHMSDALVTVNIPKGEIEKHIPTAEKGTHMVVLSPDKKRAYAANAGTGSVTVADLEKQSVIATIPTGQRAEGIAISPDGKTVTCGNVGANTVSVIDTQSLRVVKTLPNTMAPIRTTFTRDGKQLFVSCPGSGELAIFDPKDWSEKSRIKLGEQKVKFQLGNQPHPIPMNYALHSDGRHLFVVMVASNAVAIVDTQTLEVVGKIDTGQVPDGIALSGVEVG